MAKISGWFEMRYLQLSSYLYFRNVLLVAQPEFVRKCVWIGWNIIFELQNSPINAFLLFNWFWKLAYISDIATIFNVSIHSLIQLVAKVYTPQQYCQLYPRHMHCFWFSWDPNWKRTDIKCEYFSRKNMLRILLSSFRILSKDGVVIECSIKFQNVIATLRILCPFPILTISNRMVNICMLFLN